MSLALVNEGVWIGTADDYEIEFVDWTGTTIRRIQWPGPGFEITDGHINAYHDDLYRSYERRGGPNWRDDFEDMWDRRLPTLPSRFPAYTHLMIANDLIWVRQFRRPGTPQQKWFGFHPDGTKAATLVLPAVPVLQQLGPDWVLLLTTDELGIEKLVVHELIRREP